MVLVALAFIVLLTVGLPALADEQPGAKWGDDMSVGFGQRIVLVGDSYLEGAVVDQIIDINILPGEERTCWRRTCIAAVIQDHFDKVDPYINVKNIGAGGSTTRDWSPVAFRTEDIHWEINRAPLFDTIPAGNIAVIHLGANDTTGFGEVDPANPDRGIGYVGPKEFRDNIATIVDTLTNRGFEHVVILGTLSGPNWREGNAFYPQPDEHMHTLGKRHRLIREATQDYVESRNFFQDRGLGGFKGRVYYVDTYHTRSLQNRRGYWNGEGDIHPTINGHWYIARDIIAALYPILGIEGEPQVDFPDLTAPQ